MYAKVLECGKSLRSFRSEFLAVQRTKMASNCSSQIDGNSTVKAQ